MKNLLYCLTWGDTLEPVQSVSEIKVKSIISQRGIIHQLTSVKLKKRPKPPVAEKEFKITECSLEKQVSHGQGAVSVLLVKFPVQHGASGFFLQQGETFEKKNFKQHILFQFSWLLRFKKKIEQHFINNGLYIIIKTLNYLQRNC